MLVSHDVMIKKLDLRGVRQPPGIILRRRPSHTGRENPRTPAPPIHSGIEALVRTTTTEAEPLSLRHVLWHGTDEGIRSHGESNLGPEECYSDHLTNSARGPFADVMIKNIIFLLEYSTRMKWRRDQLSLENNSANGLDHAWCLRLKLICISSFS
jgi:hypothetical protein